MNRSVLLGFAIVVLAGLGALYFLVIRDAPATGPAPPAPAPTDGTARSTGPGPALSTDPVLTSSRKPRTTDTGDMVVTDHRTSGEAQVVPAEGTGSAAPPAGPRLPNPLVRSVHQNAMNLVLTCGRMVDKSDRGAKPRIGAKIKVAITDGQLRVSEVVPETQDLAGAELERTKTCVHDVLMGLEVPSPDVPDVASVDLSLSYSVR